MIICAMRFDIARHYPNEADLPKTPKQIEHLSHNSNMVVNSPVFFGWIVMLAGSFGFAYAVEARRLRNNDQAVEIATGALVARILVILMKVGLAVGMTGALAVGMILA